MTKTAGVALFLALVLEQAGWTQAQMPVFVGTNAKPVSQNPAPDPDDTPESIAKDAERDVNANRFYNKPGATRAAFDSAWQDCRLIARGSRTPSGTIFYNYDPAVMSPMAAGVGGALGGLIVGMIAEGDQRRANRRACLLIRGWRMVEPSAEQSAKLAAMREPDRRAWFDEMIGADKVDGKITERKSFTQLSDPAMNLDAAITGTSSLYFGKKIPPETPLALEPGEGAIVLAFRRSDPTSAGRHGGLVLARYDIEKRELIYQPKDWKKKGDKTSYTRDIFSDDRKAGLEVQIVRLTAGDYVLTSMGLGNVLMTGNCFGAPVFHVGAGEVLYIGDFIPFWGTKLSNGGKAFQLSYTSHPEDSRNVIGRFQPELARRMQLATWRNNATYGCGAVSMDRFDLPGAEPLPAMGAASPAEKIDVPVDLLASDNVTGVS
ncbi:MAG: hypothetical protein ACOY5R_22085 [Pseudomonadota bacterium]|uniref:hypothetical protein n=1 Tax=Rhizorhabdus phycosphaerae TaxID=2711156 RepID=UPI0019CF9D90|nr:hypothetical protein [Rhizorhabdus phycosphaerae]